MKEIATILLSAEAVTLDTKTGFTYTSGIQSPIYCDNRLLLSYPEHRDAVLDAFVTLIKEKKLESDIIAGVATAGIPWATLIADRLGKPLVYVRAKAKDHGKTNQIEGELEEGKTVLVVEDLVSTGGSSLAACEAIDNAAARVIGCVAIFNYDLPGAKGFAEKKIPLYSLSTFTELLTVASEKKAIDEAAKQSLVKWHEKPTEWSP